MSKMSTVSLVGGGVEFQPVPTSDLPAVVAARKARTQTRTKVFKIAGLTLLVLAAVAALSAYLITAKDNYKVPESPNRMARNLDDVSRMPEVQEVSLGNSKFGLNLYNRIKKEISGNIIMSPFSVSSVMAMVTGGANGETQAQLLKGMQFPAEVDKLKTGYSALLPTLHTDGNITLETANSAFIQAGLKLTESYQKELANLFATEFKSADFGGAAAAAAKMINGWVEEKTRQKIKDLIKEDMLSPEVKMVLVNAIYFKGDWARQFDKKSTQEEDFFVAEGKTVKAKLMFKEEKFNTTEHLGANIVELPYKGDRISMYVVCPKEKFGLAKLEDDISGNIEEFLHKLERKGMEERKVQLWLPSFKLECSIQMTDHLKQLGMPIPFSTGADFSGMTGSRDLFLSQVFQKAFIEVNEEGSEAAAATAGIMMLRSMPLPSPEIRLDHPFLFFLRDRLTGMVLFQGRVTDPTAQ